MSRVDQVLKLYRQGWTPSRISRDLRLDRNEVSRILDGKNSWERLGVGGGSVGDEILAALERHAGDYDVAEVEAQVELLLELADRLDAAKGWDERRRRSLCFSLEHVLDSIVRGFTWSESVLAQIHFRMALKSLRVDESEWPAWVRP